MGISHYTINEKVSKTRASAETVPRRTREPSAGIEGRQAGVAVVGGVKNRRWLGGGQPELLAPHGGQQYNPVFDSLRKKKWLYPRFNEGCSHFSFCNDMCYIFFVPGFTCLVSLMIVRIDDFVINS